MTASLIVWRSGAAAIAIAWIGAACASSTSQTDVASKGGVPSVTQISTTDPNLRTELAAESDMYSLQLAAPPDSVWMFLPDVWNDLEMPVTMVDPDNRVIGTENHRVRRIERKRLSQYLDCGEGITATPYADQYEVTLTLLTQVRPLQTYRTLLVSEIRATARARASSGNAIPCTSRRTLEERIAELAAEKIAAARAAAPVGDRVGVLVIHGMGSQRAGFSTGLIDEVSRRLDERAKRVEWKEIHWGHAIESREDALWQAMQDATEPDGDTIRLDWRGLREFVIHNFGDAVAYQRDYYPTSAYTIIHGIVSAEIASLKTSLNDPTAPIVVLAHSLGAHIMSNYLWDRQHWPKTKSKGKTGTDPLEPIDTLFAMITFGANIPLFGLAFDVAKPIHVPGAAIKKASLKTLSRWLNFVDRDDVLGWPLRPLYEAHMERLTKAQQATVRRIEDHEINVGSLLTSWNPAAHGNYWTDNDLTRPVADYLKRVLEAV